LTGSRAPSFLAIEPRQLWFKFLKCAASDTVNDHGLLRSQRPEATYRNASRGIYDDLLQRIYNRLAFQELGQYVV
jgi:hypothetical protein